MSRLRAATRAAPPRRETSCDEEGDQVTRQRDEEQRADPIACTLTGTDLKTQRERWNRVCGEAGTRLIETEDGVRVVFANQPGVTDELRALVAVENECCSWARWTVSFEGDAGLMDARARGDGIAILHDMFIDGFPAQASTPDC